MKEEKKIFSKKNIMGMIIVFLMVFSVLGMWQGSDDGMPDYNEFKVTQKDNKYEIKTDKGIVQGYTYPGYLEGIPLDTTLLVYTSLLYSPTVTILFDPADPALAYVEVLRMELVQQDFMLLGKSVAFAITQANDAYQYPVVNCSSTSPIVYIHTTNTTTFAQIYQDENCLVLESLNWRDLVSLKDRLVYTLYDVMI
ncbi:MAG: hypothetical protein WC254_04920 [Candidatus Woesearchaeota archaeon]|jgi:hypothetical protein